MAPLICREIPLRGDLVYVFFADLKWKQKCLFVDEFSGAKSPGGTTEEGAMDCFYTSLTLVDICHRSLQSDHGTASKWLRYAWDSFGSSWAVWLQSRYHCPTHFQMYFNNSHVKGPQCYFILIYTESTVMPSGCFISSIYGSHGSHNDHAIIGALLMMYHLGPEQENHNPIVFKCSLFKTWDLFTKTS